MVRFPLAVCDMRTVASDDVINARIAEKSLEIAMATHSPAHSWWYYPNMQPGEVMLILTYDSAAAPFVPTLHCAFDDPASPAATEEGAQRESIEARLLLVMPEADGGTAKL